MTNQPPTQGQFHAVRFYESSDALQRIVAEFLGEGLLVGEPGLVIATSVHRAGIVSELRARNIDVDRVQAAGDLVLCDAAEMLDAFMVDGLPNEKRFMNVTLTTIERVCRGRTDCRVRAYGEMVDVLWREKQSIAAIRLEMLWNKLAATQKFSLLCGYAMGHFYKDAEFKDICNQHTHVVSPAGEPAPAIAERIN